jgi:hypothetical protein
MKKTLPLALLAAFLLPLPAFAQSGDKLPPANPIPYEADADTAGVLAAANRLLASLSQGGDAVLAHVRPEGRATVARERPDGVHEILPRSWQEFAEQLRADGHRYEERLIDPAIDVDGDIAMIWSPYVFLVDGKIVHCGTNHFDLVRSHDGWKVLNVTWTQRTKGCPTK